jgi:hypothetical protein
MSGYPVGCIFKLKIRILYKMRALANEFQPKIKKTLYVLTEIQIHLEIVSIGILFKR